MLLKICNNYIKNSGIWITFALNPCHWKLDFATVQPDDMNPKAHGFFVAILPLSVRIIVDDGSW